MKVQRFVLIIFAISIFSHNPNQAINICMFLPCSVFNNNIPKTTTVIVTTTTAATTSNPFYPTTVQRPNNQLSTITPTAIFTSQKSTTVSTHLTSHALPNSSHQALKDQLNETTLFTSVPSTQSTKVSHFSSITNDTQITSIESSHTPVPPTTSYQNKTKIVLNQTFYNNTNTNTNTQWSNWYTIYCVVLRIRRNLYNSSLIQTVNITITNLGQCDKIEESYIKQMVIQDNIKLNNSIEEIENRTKTRFNNLENSYSVSKTTSTSLAGLMVICVIAMLSFIIGLDLTKLVYFINIMRKIDILKKRVFRDRKIKASNKMFEMASTRFQNDIFKKTREADLKLYKQMKIYLNTTNDSGYIEK